MKKLISILLFILMWAAVLGGLGAYAWWCSIADGWLLWLPVLVIPLLGVHLIKRRGVEKMAFAGCFLGLFPVLCGAALTGIMCLANWRTILMSGWVGFSFTSIGLLLYLWAVNVFSWSSWIGKTLARIPWFDPVVSLHAADWNARRKTVGRMTDQAALAAVANNDENFDARRAAVARLTGQDALADVAKNDEKDEMEDVYKEETVVDFHDQYGDHYKTIQRYVGQRLKHAAPIGMAALAKISSPPLLADIAKNARHAAVREAAADAIAIGGSAANRRFARN